MNKENKNIDLALVNKSDLDFSDGGLILNAKQLDHILSKTPDKYIRQRPAKGGGKWDYVTVGYIQKVLNLMFGWDWDFEILEDNIQMVGMGTANEVVVKGRLTCRIGDKTIVKTQYGNKDVMYRKNADENGVKHPLSIGNDLKAAASDSLKKCASLIGIAADIYNKQEFRAIKVQQEKTESQELTEREIKAQEHIKKAKDIKTLKQVEMFVQEYGNLDNQLSILYIEKEQELQ